MVLPAVPLVSMADTSSAWLMLGMSDTILQSSPLVFRKYCVSIVSFWLMLDALRGHIRLQALWKHNVSPSQYQLLGHGEFTEYLFERHEVGR